MKKLRIKAHVYSEHNVSKMPSVWRCRQPKKPSHHPFVVGDKAIPQAVPRAFVLSIHMPELIILRYINKILHPAFLLFFLAAISFELLYNISCKHSSIQHKQISKFTNDLAEFKARKLRF